MSERSNLAMHILAMHIDEAPMNAWPAMHQVLPLRLDPAFGQWPHERFKQYPPYNLILRPSLPICRSWSTITLLWPYITSAASTKVTNPHAVSHPNISTIQWLRCLEAHLTEDDKLDKSRIF